jgi:hypothetical protein
VREGFSCPFIVQWDKQQRGCFTAEELELIQPEVQEPVPGKFYRTREGNKLMFVGKTLKNKYLYDSKKDGLWVFDTRTTVNKDSPFRCDIVGEWVDSPESQVLPAMEIKRWSLICNKDYGRWKRGEFRFADNSIQEIEKVLNVYVEKEERKYWEIVELVGTLPERKVSK